MNRDKRRSSRSRYHAAPMVAALAIAASSIMAPAEAYEVVEVQQGGTIQGHVTLSGAIPEPTTLVVWSLLGTLGIAVTRPRRARRAVV